MARRIRKGDSVAVISGDDRGKRGRVLRVIPDQQRVIVEGVNLVFKHLRRSQKNPQGGRVRREAPIHWSNVQPVDPETNRPTRVGVRVEEDRRIRFGRRSGAAIGTPVGGRRAGGKTAGAQASAKEGS